jgi:hypothetical protein
MPTPRKAPSLLAISIAWSAAIAFVMTAVTFLHQTPGEVANAAGDLGPGQVGILFLAWFVAAELTLLIGGGLYLGVTLLLRGGRQGRG